MSHLSILPTVFTRLDLLERSLIEEGFVVQTDGSLPDFGTSPRSVDLLARREGSRPLGWVHRDDGTIVMVGDLQRISLQSGMALRLQRVTRCYALLEALEQVEALASSDLNMSVTTSRRV